MLPKLKNISLLLLIGLLLGCENPTDPDVPRSITGKVVLKNGDDGSTLVNHSGVVVALKATPYSAVTNSEGLFTFTDIPPGIYVMTYAKDGFDSLIVPSYEYSGVGVDFVQDINLYTTSVGRITLATIINTRLSSLLGNYGEIDSIRIDTIRGVFEPDSIGLDSSVYILGERFNASEQVIIISGNASNLSRDLVRLELKGENGNKRTVKPQHWVDEKFISIWSHNEFDDQYGSALWGREAQISVKAFAVMAEGTQVVESETQILIGP